MHDDIDDGKRKPLGYTTDDGELEVRESVDRDGTPFRGYHETELGQHQRWLRQAPDLFALYQEAIAKLAAVRQEPPPQTWRDGVQAAIDTIMERAKVENHVVQPGMWFAAGWVEKRLLPSPPAPEEEK